MDQTNRMKIGQATYEIGRVFRETQTVSDIIQAILVNRTEEPPDLT